MCGNFGTPKLIRKLQDLACFSAHRELTPCISEAGLKLSFHKLLDYMSHFNYHNLVYMLLHFFWDKNHDFVK